MSILCIGIVVDIGTVINHRVNIYLSGDMEIIIFFPIANGASIILCTVISALVFKEKYSAKQYAELGIGIMAILLLSDVISNFIKL